MIRLLNAQSAASSVAYIGRDVQYTDSTTTYSDAPITFGYVPAEEAKSITLKVVDIDGNTVRTLEAERSPQRHTVTWDGLDDDGNEVPEGAYTFVVSAKDDLDKSIEVATDVTGRVTGAASDSTGNSVLIRGMAVAIPPAAAPTETAVPTKRHP